MKFFRPVLRSSLLAVAALPMIWATTPGVVWAQDQDSAAVPEQEWTPPAPPSLFQVPVRAGAVVDSAAQAQEEIQRLTTVGDPAEEVREAAARTTELRALIESMVDLDVIRLERLSRLRDQALLEDGRLENLRTRLTDRLDELDEVRENWLQQDEVWRSWRAGLRDQEGYEAVAPDMAQALESIEAVLEATSEGGRDLLTLQREVESLRADIARVSDVLSDIRSRRREALLERSQPVLLSGAHRAELAEAGWRAWNPMAALEPAAYVAFARGHLGLLGFHILLAVLLGFLVRRLRPRVVGDEAWRGLTDLPFTLGIFASVVVAMVRVTLAPPLWDVFLWILFGVTAARIARHVFADRAVRAGIYLLALFYPAFLFLEVAELPESVLRLGLVAVAAGAIPLFFILARDRSGAPRATEAGSVWTWPLRIGTGVWGAVLLAVFVGFDALGRWMLHAAVMTAAVSFVVFLAFVLIRAGAGTLGRSSGTGNLWHRAGSLLVQRAIVLVRIALVVGAALVLLDVWGVAESPLAIWRRITDLGFSVGSVRFTIGGLLSGALVIYVAVLLSGLVRSLLVYELQEPARPGYPRSRAAHSPSHGAGQSISKLVHYLLITLGVVFALGAIGVELQNFAIIAGALGIGVGFGLQNVVNNFASGLILLMERPVRVGDTVVVGEEWGTIQKIGLRSTVMLTLDQSEMIVPNGDLVSEKVVNWTLSSPIARIIMPVGVAYGTSVADVLRILEEASMSHDSVLEEPRPEALFMEFGESSLDFELRVWVKNIRLRLEVRSAILARIDTLFREVGIVIPFPQRDLHIRSIDPDVLARLKETVPG